MYKNWQKYVDINWQQIRKISRKKTYLTEVKNIPKKF